MPLTHHDIHPLSRWSRQAREIYEEAFPERERYPFWAMKLAGLLPANRFWAHVDGEQLAGISFHAIGRSAAYVLYLAVNGRIRSKGYGTRILASIVEGCGGLPVSLDVEEPDDAADNAEQRLARIRFYERNGFRDAGHVVHDAGDAYLVLTTAPEGGFDAAALEQAIGAITLGIGRTKVEPRI